MVARRTMTAFAVIVTMSLNTVSVATVMGPHQGGPVRTAPDAQLAALLSLYNATGGPHWVNTTGWSSVPRIDPCTAGALSWFGVTCNGTNVTCVLVVLRLVLLHATTRHCNVLTVVPLVFMACFAWQDAAT
jgi:hypothetical protein